jgi:preprotein translocase subunit SecG
MRDRQRACERAQRRAGRRVPGGCRCRGEKCRAHCECEEKGPAGRHGTRVARCYPRRALLQALVFFHLVTSVALIGLVLMHSGRDTGMAGMGFVPQSQGGTHIVERNLTRLTIAVGTIFFINTVLLYRMLA